jgi:hypothetical protein
MGRIAYYFNVKMYQLLQKVGIISLRRMDRLEKQGQVIPDYGFASYN